MDAVAKSITWHQRHETVQWQRSGSKTVLGYKSLATTPYGFRTVFRMISPLSRVFSSPQQPLDNERPGGKTDLLSNACEKTFVLLSSNCQLCGVTAAHRETLLFHALTTLFPTVLVVCIENPLLPASRAQKDKTAR